MNDKLNMDKQIREKLDGFSVAPPPHLWSNIQGQMAAQQKKKRLAYIGWISAAAVVVFAFVAGWFFNEKTNLETPAMVEQEIVSPKATERTLEQQVDIVDESSPKAMVAETQKTNNNETDKKSKAFTSSDYVVQELEIEDDFVATLERISYDLLESLEAIFITEENNLNLAERKELEKTEITITTNDAVLMAANAKIYQKQKTKENGWILGAHVSPGYSSQSSNHDQDYAENMTYNGSSGGANVGGGVSLQYKTGKRLRVESGVYYSQNGQSASSGSGELFGSRNNFDYAYAPENLNDAMPAPAYSNAVQLSGNGIALNSVAGVINMKATPKGASVATNAEYTNAKFANTLTTNGEFSQVFEFVEVPFYLRYSLLDKKFGIELVGGLNAGIVVGNNAYIDNSYGKQNIGSTEDISTVNLSGAAGIGFNYMLGKHFSLALEPRFNYYLNSINTNSDVNYRPYRLGLYTGVYYEF